MTPNRSTGFTRFFLAYGAEAVLPSNIDHGAPRIKAFDSDRAVEAQQDVVDLLEEARETTIIRSARYQQTLRRYHERQKRGEDTRSQRSCTPEDPINEGKTQTLSTM